MFHQVQKYILTQFLTNRYNVVIFPTEEQSYALCTMMNTLQHYICISRKLFLLTTNKNMTDVSFECNNKYINCIHSLLFFTQVGQVCTKENSDILIHITTTTIMDRPLTCSEGQFRTHLVFLYLRTYNYIVPKIKITEK